MVRWTHGGVEVEGAPRPVWSDAYGTDPPSIVIIEEPTTPTLEPMRNAAVYDLDGTRCGRGKLLSAGFTLAVDVA